MSVLPKGWVETTLGDLGRWQGGGTPDKSNASYWAAGNIPWVSPKDMKRFLISEAEDLITEAALAASSTNLIPEGSTLIVTRSGILKHTLPVALTGAPVAINQDIKALTPSSELDSVFVARQIEALGPFVLRNCTKAGTTVDSVDFDRLKGVNVPLPPLAEQKRIVAKLDALNAKSTRARTELARIETLVARYKQAVLGKAFSGDLTREWRDGRNVTWPWKTQLWAECGETLNGRAFPSGDYSISGVKLLRPGNLGADGQVFWTEKNTRYLPNKYTREFPGHFIKGEALLINLTAQSLEDQFLGRACLASPSDEFMLNQRIGLFRPRDLINKFCLYALKGPDFRRFIDNGMNSGSLIQHVHTKQLEQYRFPVPSLEEQHEIVRRIETAFSRIDRLAAEAKRALELLGRLDEAILAEAFRGELVPQDETDEPAEHLLARIRAERAAAPKTKRGRGKQT